MNGIVNLVRENPDQFSQEFTDWIVDNLHIWDAFRLEANRVRSKGRTHYSSRTIVEFLRHNTTLSDTDSAFKINDHCVPYLGRLYVMTHHGSRGFFEFRKIKPKNPQKPLPLDPQ
jgi:hypothetical protein